VDGLLVTGVGDDREQFGSHQGRLRHRGLSHRNRAHRGRIRPERTEARGGAAGSQDGGRLEGMVHPGQGEIDPSGVLDLSGEVDPWRAGTKAGGAQTGSRDFSRVDLHREHLLPGVYLLRPTDMTHSLRKAPRQGNTFLTWDFVLGEEKD